MAHEGKNGINIAFSSTAFFSAIFDYFTTACKLITGTFTLIHFISAGGLGRYFEISGVLLWEKSAKSPTTTFLFPSEKPCMLLFVFRRSSNFWDLFLLHVSYFLFSLRAGIDKKFGT
jgi:hypothetical protein